MNHLFEMLVASTSFKAQTAARLGLPGSLTFVKSTDEFRTIGAAPSFAHPFPMSTYTGTSITKLSDTPDWVMRPESEPSGFTQAVEIIRRKWHPAS